MKKYKTAIAWIFILLAVVILVSLPYIVYPEIGENGIDNAQYFLEVTMHIVRYTILSIFSFVLGIKLLFKN